VRARELAAADVTLLPGLAATGPYPAWREHLMTFGQFVGVWDMDVRYFDPAGCCTYHGAWEWSFAWILDGRAIQDVIVNLGPPGGPVHRTAGGTTVRYCDPATGEWIVYFLGVLTGITTVLRGGRDGDTIILAGPDPDGTKNRWTFSDITPDSFTWTGLESAHGAPWWRNQQMLGTRRR
jgi:hypothetical protein